MPAIVHTSTYGHGVITGWAIDRTMKRLAKRVRASGRDGLADRLEAMQKSEAPGRGATYLGGGFTLIVGDDG